MTTTTTAKQIRDAAADWDDELLENLLATVETVKMTSRRSEIVEAVAAWASDNEPSYEEAHCSLALLGLASAFEFVAAKYAELDAAGYWAE